MRLEDAKVGAWVRAGRAFSGVPAGTIGVIDEEKDGLFLVAWDGPGTWARLPEGYPVPVAWGTYAGATRLDHDVASVLVGARGQTMLLRDAFDAKELSLLDYVGTERPAAGPPSVKESLEAAGFLAETGIMADTSPLEWIDEARPGEAIVVPQFVRTIESLRVPATLSQEAARVASRLAEAAIPAAFGVTWHAMSHPTTYHLAAVYANARYLARLGAIALLSEE